MTKSHTVAQSAPSRQRKGTRLRLSSPIFTLIALFLTLLVLLAPDDIITPSSYLWLLLLFLVGFWRFSLFVPLLFLSAAFQASALINIDLGAKSVPLLPYYFLLVVLAVWGLAHLLLVKRIRFNRVHYHTVSWLLFFVFISFFLTWIGPVMFHGLPVYVPIKGIDAQYNNMERLEFSFSMIGQALYLLLNFVGVLILAGLWRVRVNDTQVVRWVEFTTLLIAGIAIWQGLHNLTGVWFPIDLLYTVKGWYLGYKQTLGGYGRVNASFAEPSMFAVFMASLLGFWIRILIKKFSWKVLFLTLLVILVLMLSSSSIAYLVILISFVIVLFRFVLLPLLDHYVLACGGLALVLIGSLVLGGAVFLYLINPNFSQFIDLVLLHKMHSLSFVSRYAADRRALEILWETHGLGVGLGGNRPSSFITFLLSNVGVWGFMAFVGFLLMLTSAKHVSYLEVSPETYYEHELIFKAASWGLWITILGMVMAVPDLSFPPLWAWIDVLVLLSVGNRQLVGKSDVLGVMDDVTSRVRQ